MVDTGYNCNIRDIECISIRFKPGIWVEQSKILTTVAGFNTYTIFHQQPQNL